MSKYKITKRRIIIFTSIILLIIYWLALPSELFVKPTSTVILSKEGKLLGARIADDGQWRFPKADSIPDKFTQCIITFEDQYFYYHPGVNIGSLFRAAYQDIKAGKIVSGGSTLSMQTIRMSKDNPPRNIYQKIKEIILATRLELRYSKDEILNLYASNAPFGSNVVGINAASWRFFGREANDLSWAETATLAVLPNAPSLIYPGKNSEKLRAKRNRLLKRIMEKGIIDSLTYSLSILESLPQKVKPLPSIAPHLLERINKENKGQKLTTTIQYDLQRKSKQILKQYSKDLRANKIYNAAILIVDVESGEVLSYIGNTEPHSSINKYGNYVDIIHSRRSSGSILKPLLYAFMLQEGKILPRTMITDVPTEIGGYQPKNFDRQFDGVVPANEALQRSLNIPAVRMLQQYGYPRFHHRLKELGFTTINRPADNYGLSLILGGAEVNLWDLAKVYSSMARVLNNFYEKEYDKSDWRAPNYIAQNPPKEEKGKILDATSIWFAFEALKHLNRPQNEQGWNLFSSTKSIAWKTGTSHGFRDAWAVGVDSKYLVAVWIGNADGEGRPGMTGLGAAAPLMFKIYDQLPESSWFHMPDPEMIQIEVCAKSGFRANTNCIEIVEEFAPKNGSDSPKCPYHKLVHLDSQGENQVNSNCESVSRMIHRKMFVLPPAKAWYYSQRHPEYMSPPPFRPDCETKSENSIEMIYPKSGARVFIPLEHSGERGAVVFEAAHKQANIKIFWHLDNKYLGTTNDFHQIAVDAPPGKHKLSLVDENGQSISVWFTVVDGG